MSRPSTLALNAACHAAIEGLRVVLVAGSALALILAGDFTPF